MVERICGDCGLPKVGKVHSCQQATIAHLRAELARRDATIRGQAALLARARQFALEVRDQLKLAIKDFCPEDECTDPSTFEAGPRPESASETASGSAAATTAASGDSSTSSAAQESAAGAARANASTVEVIDGWRCESFGRGTGHSAGRSAQLGDLQICLTVDDPEPETEERLVPVPVLTWLLTGRGSRG